MPNGNKGRPSTLELEVLSGSLTALADGRKNDSDEISKQIDRQQDDQQQEPTQQQFDLKTKSKETSSKQPRQQQEQQQSVRRWFQFARKSRRKEPINSPKSENCVALGAAIPTATLAQPEPTTIANSTNTILTTPNNYNEQHAATILEVDKVQTHANAKQLNSNTTHTESLYSLATLAQGNTIQLPTLTTSDFTWPCAKDPQPDAEPKAKVNAKLEITPAAEPELELEPAILLAEQQPQTTLLSAGMDNLCEDVNGGATTATHSSSIRGWLLNVFGKLSFWKYSNCQTKTRRNSFISHDTYTDNNASQKSCKASVEFEQFPINMERKSSTAESFVTATAKSIRRLSQIRRRRSSYYFSENERRIRANDREFNSQFKYSDNYIKTSKYSLLTFLPFNLLEQFQRLANFYFLCLLVLQLIPAISSLTPVTTAIPLIGVLTLTAVKDAYDDIQRHLSDSQVNNRKSKTLRNGKLVDEKWSGVQVGDVIRMENNQFVAADILLLTTSEPNGLCFIETAELDGETNLKCKQCLPETTELGQHHDILWNFNGEIICERPNNLLNKFEGTLLWKNQRFSLDNEKILLRGCVLRNTQWCYGVVVFAGEDTKLMQNSGKTQFKSTGVDRLLNFIIIGIVLFLISICAFFTFACAIWEGLIGQHFQVYLPWENIIPKNVPQGATVIGLLVFFSYAIVLNTVVPISLYVSVEVIRFAQSFLINWDEDMCYKRTNTHAKARTTTLNEELGQIQYIFSDKTGTLTQNIMTFNKCSINGRAYGDVIDLRTGEVIEVTDQPNYNANSKQHNNCTASHAPTILLHEAEVHTKSSLILTPTTPDPDHEQLQKNTANSIELAEVGKMNGYATAAATLKTTQATPKQQRSVSILDPNDSDNEKPDSTLRLLTSKSFEIHSKFDQDNNAINSSKSDKKKPNSLFKKNVTFTSSVKPGFRRTVSTQSKYDDKVMMLKDMPISSTIITTTQPPAKALIVTQSQQNSKTLTTVVDEATLTKFAFIPPTTTFYNASTHAAQNHATSATTTRENITFKKSISYSPSATFCELFDSSHDSNYCEYNDTWNKSTKTTTNNSTHTNSPNLNTDSTTENDNSLSLNNLSNHNSTNPASLSSQHQQAQQHNHKEQIPQQKQEQEPQQQQHKVHTLEPVDFSSNPEYEPEFRWYDRTLLDAVRSDEDHSHNFFRLLALCHTVMPEYVEGRLEYQAQSPDESALVSAARNFGFVFRSRTPNSITIEVMGRTEEYELLHILDFNNVRKRMSVILRRGNDIVLYCKGADNVIYDRLSSSQNDIKARTQDHLNKFAGEGLRTLVLAERRLDETYFENWRSRHQEAVISLQAREDKVNAMYEEIESDMVLVGVTAIEDKLQDGVPQAIANLQMAGIKIWVLTGDKQETAINIGYSCQLLTDELADVFIVDGSSMEEVQKQLRQFKESIRIVNRFRPTTLEPTVNLSFNDSHDSRSHSALSHNAAFRAHITPPPPPAISVVTFRWDDKIKHNKGEPDSAECSELYDNLEKGSQASPKHKIKEDDIFDDSSGFAIVINGHSLVHCLSPELESKFLDIASQCKAVICCRVTPLQKALVVELIKRAKNAVTLAIGDGANDVSMIKAAHIGVGISGQEGLQAVLASDYSIAQFRFLERLLLVHGRWSYYRMCKFLRYFFYKNFAFTLCHCWYSFFCGFSAQTVFDPMFISVYNLFYTSLPVLALGIFEQDVSDKLSIEYPKLYTPGLRSELFNIREFVYSVMHGCFSSLILFLIPYGTYKDGVSPTGYVLSDHMTLGAVVATILIIDNTAQIALYTSYWTVFNHIMIWGSLVWYFVLDYFYNYVIGGPYVGSLTQAMKDLTFWATMFITVVVIMAPVLAYKFYLLDVHPQLTDKIRLKRRQATLRSRQAHDVIRTPSARRARRSLRSGYAFAHQEGFGRLITSGKIMRKLPQEFAFPLGLGSKKIQNTSLTPTTASAPNQNNNNMRDNKNSSTGDLNSYSNGNGNGVRGAISADLSPRAPCQDLDTINL